MQPTLEHLVEPGFSAFTKLKLEKEKAELSQRDEQALGMRLVLLGLTVSHSLSDGESN